MFLTLIGTSRHKVALYVYLHAIHYCTVALGVTRVPLYGRPVQHLRLSLGRQDAVILLRVPYRWVGDALTAATTAHTTLDFGVLIWFDRLVWR